MLHMKKTFHKVSAHALDSWNCIWNTSFNLLWQPKKPQRLNWAIITFKYNHHYPEVSSILPCNYEIKFEFAGTATEYFKDHPDAAYCSSSSICQHALEAWVRPQQQYRLLAVKFFRGKRLELFFFSVLIHSWT